jgi:hypothetical protein
VLPYRQFKALDVFRWHVTGRMDIDVCTCVLVLLKPHFNLCLRRKVCNQCCQVASADRVLSKSCRWLAVVCLRATEHLALEKGHRLAGASDGPFGLRLAHASLSDACTRSNSIPSAPRLCRPMAAHVPHPFHMISVPTP